MPLTVAFQKHNRTSPGHTTNKTTNKTTSRSHIVAAANAAGIEAGGTGRCRTQSNRFAQCSSLARIKMKAQKVMKTEIPTKNAKTNICHQPDSDHKQGSISLRYINIYSVIYQTSHLD